MNLGKKKALAAKTLKVGKNRIVFNVEALPEIKQAITKQDIISLKQDGMITIKPVKGRKTVVRRKTRRGPGKIKKTVNKRKREYVMITRKLRGYVKQLREIKSIDRETYKDLRKKIKMRIFKSQAALKDYLKGLNEVSLKKTAKIEKESKTRKPVKKTIKGEKE